MSDPIATIRHHMTATPHSVGSEQTIAKASSMMSEYHIGHLPVLQGGRLLGILTERDIKLMAGGRDADPTKITVAEAMTEQLYTVNPDTPLDEVVETMASKNYGSAVVVQNHKVVGIFTTGDAFTLAEQLKPRHAT